MSAAAQERAISWGRQGAESLVAALKIVTDLTAQEVALVVGMLRERVSLRPAASTVEMAGRMVSGLADAGKVLLDLTAGESAVIAEGLKDGLRLRPGVAAMVDLVPRGVETFIEMQKGFLDSIRTQSQEVAEAYASGEPLTVASRLAGMTRERVESFIQTQTKFLDLVTEQVNLATTGGGTGKTPAPPDRAEVLARLAREGMGKFIEAQKQLVDLAVEQLESTAHETRAKTAVRTSLAELTRRSVETFATAQKSLLSLVVIPETEGVEPPRTARPAAKKPRARKRAAAAAATK